MVKTTLISLLFLCGVTLLCLLGFWQLTRAAQKQVLLNQMTAATEQTSLSGTALLTLKHDTSLRYLPVSFKSVFVNQYTILLDNKVHQGQAGYHVIVPAVLNDQTLILVNRGWIPLGKSRQQLPTVPPVIGEVTIEGSLDFAYLNPLIPNALESQIPSWPLRVQQLDLEQVSHLIGKKISPMIVNLNQHSPFAFVVPPKEKMAMPPERHQGYAVQWFSLAATLFIFYLIYLRKRSKV